MDRNGDGKLDEKEALAGLNSRAFESDASGDGDPAEVAKKRSTDFMAAFDTDGDRSLGVKEIPNALGREVQRIDQSEGGRREAGEVASKRTEATIAAVDGDGDGKISQQESRGTAVQGYFNNADEKAEGERRGDGQLTKEELTNYFSKREAGRDGEISSKELAAYFEKFQPGEDGVLSMPDLKRSIGGYRNGQGDGPRGTPTVVGDRLYTEGGNGDVTCLDTATGKTIWHVNLVEDFGGGRPGWGYSESPLVEGNLVFVTPGGKDGSMVALNRNTGEQVWRSAGVDQGAHYSSPIVTEIAGQETGRPIRPGERLRGHFR